MPSTLLATWKESAVSLGSTEYTKAFDTIMNRFTRFYALMSEAMPSLPRAVPKYPSTEVLEAFVGYLAQQKTMGGTTIQSYLARLPTALARYHQMPTSEPRLVIPKVIKRMMERAAWSVPQVHPITRDAISLAELLNVVNDPEADELVVAAMVIQFHLGVRGINVYSTGKSREVGKDRQRALQWGDLRFLAAANGEPSTWMVTLRQEKTATSYTGSFAPKPLTSSPDVAKVPCPVHALQVASRYRQTDDADALVFPSVRDDEVNKLLQKHSAPGRKLTTHSIRKGRVTVLKEAGMDGSELRLAGNWSSDLMADKYAAPRGRHAANVHAALAKAHAATTPTAPAVKPHSPVNSPQSRQDTTALSGVGQPFVRESSDRIEVHTPDGQRRSARQASRKAKTDPRVGTIRLPHKGTDRVLLLAHWNAKYFRGYFYCSETHMRKDFEGISNAGLQPYEPFNRADLHYLLSNSDEVPQALPGSDMENDQAVIRYRAQSSVYGQLADRPRKSYPTGKQSPTNRR